MTCLQLDTLKLYISFVFSLHILHLYTDMLCVHDVIYNNPGYQSLINSLINFHTFK